MNNRFNLLNFQPTKGAILAASPDHVAMRVEPGQIGQYELAGQPGHVGGADWKNARYLVADVTCHMDWSIVFMFEFWEEGNDTDEPNITVRMSTLPGVKTRLALPLSALDSQRIFLPRTPGKLRTFVHGKKTDVARVHRFALSVREGFEEQTLDIEDVYLTDEEPAYPLPDVKLVDELGQLMTRDWPGKTATEDEMVAALREDLQHAGEATYPEEWSPYGGWKKKKLEARGFFSLQHDGRRWWLVDPDGSVFFTTGMDCVRPGDDGPVKSIRKFFTWAPSEQGEFADAWEEPRWWKDKIDDKQFFFARANLIRAFGADWRTNWDQIVRAHLVRWGCNTVGAFSDERFTAGAKMPYLLPLMGFPTTKKKVFRDFPDVFSPEYETNAAVYAEQMRPHADDKYIIGYFLRNEPEWAFTADLEIAEELLDTDGDLITKDELIRFLSGRYGGSVAAFNAAWGLTLSSFDDLRQRRRGTASLSTAAAKDLNDFSRIMIEQYVKVPSLAVRRVDPVHLNLGMRYAFILYPNQLAGKEYLDVFSINCYKINPADVLRHTIEQAQMPVMIGEFHFGALDRGVQATGIIGVASQRDRGLAYRCYVENAAAFPECVGVQYFQLYDQAAMGRPDGENYQIGFLDVCNRPHEEFAREAADVNFGIYEVASGERPVSDVHPKKIISNIAS